MMGLLAWSAGCNRPDAGRSPEKVGEPVRPQAVAEERIAPPEKPAASADAVVMALSFVPGQTTTYKLSMQTERRVEYLGNVPSLPNDLQPGRTNTQVDMTFDQQVESVNADGNAILKITLRSLKYLGQSRDKAIVDFDGSRAEDRQSPLAKLVGQSYQLEMSPSGAIVAVIDARSARAAIAGNLPGNQTAQKLITDEAITERHRVTPLIAAQNKAVRKGDTWANVKVVSFGLMGTDTLQQAYTLTSVDRTEGRRIAVVEMEAIPSAALAQQLHEKLNAPVNASSIDNSQRNVGRFRLDLTNQRIDECSEDLTKEWVTALPDKDPQGGYVGMRMTATQRYRLERVEK
jgi:hypothetical protein